MTSRSRRQLVLDLVRVEALRPVTQPPEGLVQALADLLLEALGKEQEERTSTNGGRDESEDHILGTLSGTRACDSCDSDHCTACGFAAIILPSTEVRTVSLARRSLAVVGGGDMFLERVPVHPMIGRTAGQFLAEYGIPVGRLTDIFNLPQNITFRNGVLAQTRKPQIEETTDLVQWDPSKAPGGSTILLPVDSFQVTASRESVVDYQGLRWQHVQGGKIVNQAFLKNCTHGLKVRLERRSIDGWNILSCNRIRWVQTAKKRNNPHPGLDEFVDGGGTDARGESFPWYNIGVNPDPLVMMDVPCGPEARAVGLGLQFVATTSLTVWTARRVTLIASYTWGFEILPGKNKQAIHQQPNFRPATGAEIQDHLRLLKIGLSQSSSLTGRNLIYRPPPAANTINQGL
jgi:hypothetical protein